MATEPRYSLHIYVYAPIVGAIEGALLGVFAIERDEGQDADIVNARTHGGPSDAPVEGAQAANRHSTPPTQHSDETWTSWSVPNGVKSERAFPDLREDWRELRGRSAA